MTSTAKAGRKESASQKQIHVTKFHGASATTGTKPYAVEVRGELLRDARGVGRRFESPRGAYMAGAKTILRRKCTVTLTQAVRVVAAVLEMPRDRLGRLDYAATDEARAARERLRELAIHYAVPGSTDTMHQCAQVLRAAVAKAGGK